MNILFKYLLVTFFCVLISVLVACGGGGGDDTSDTNPPPQTKPNAISGTVNAPGGMLASLQRESMYAQLLNFLVPSVAADITGVAPVSNATVELIQVDGDGNQVGAVVETTTTNASGEFAINTALNLSINLIIQVTANSSVVMRAFVTGETTNINPATEYIVNEIINAIQTQVGVTLANFSTQEITGLVQTVNDQTIDLTGNDIETALTNIETAVGTTIDNEIVAAINGTSALAVKVFLEGIPGVDGTVTANDSEYQATVTILQNGNSRSGVTNAQGIAIFSDATSDPVTVTAQYEYTYTDAIIRGALTIHDLIPTNGEVGIFVISDYEAEPIASTPTSGTSVSGTILNIPNLLGDYNNITVRLDPVSGCCDQMLMSVPLTSGQTSADYNFTNNGQLGLGTGEYKVYAEISTSAINDGYITDYFGAAVYKGVLSVVGGNTYPYINIDFDDPDSRIEFESKSLMVTNINPGAFFEQSEIKIRSFISIPGIGEFGFSTFSNAFPDGLHPYQIPSTASFISSAPAGSNVKYNFSLEGDGKAWEVEFPLSSVTSLSVNFLIPPVNSLPVANTMYTAEQASQLTASWENPNSTLLSYHAVIFGTSDYTQSPSGIDGVDGVFWVHVVKPDVTSFTLPELPIPMFGPGSVYFYFHEFAKTDDAFIFENVFDFNVVDYFWSDSGSGGFNSVNISIPFSTSSP